MLAMFSLSADQWPVGTIKQDAASAGGALVYGKDGGRHGNADVEIGMGENTGDMTTINSHFSRRRALHGQLREGLFGWLLLLISPILGADESGGIQAAARGSLYYTDDVAIFSATRRLSLNADPTQPALDDRLMGQGADGVFETALKLSREFTSDYGKTRLDATGDGFIFMTKTQFTHGTLRLQARHEFTEKTALNFTYYFSPDLYLGENLVRQPVPALDMAQPETGPSASEVLTSNILSLRLDQALTDNLVLQMLGRYGLRDYDPAFAERDLYLWTIGPHLEWSVSPELKWLVGYHFERGMADGRYQPWLADDVSYDNNFVSTELEYEFIDSYQLTLGLHYELNDWLSQQEEDERYGTYENVYQGEVLLQHDLNEDTRLYGGVQYSYRTVNTDFSDIANVNVSMGVEVKF